MHRPGDVLDLLLAHVRERKIELVSHLIAHDPADAYPAWLGQGFETGGNVDAVSIDILVVDNSKEGDKTRRFVISPQDYMAAETHALDHDWTLLGIYHSHPKHPAIPSEHDRIAAQPYFSYVIISVMESNVGGETFHLRSWLLNEEQQFEEEEIIDTIHSLN